MWPTFDAHRNRAQARRPPTGGFEFQATRAISRDPATRAVPIILCTSKSQETDKIWGMRQGARDYVMKPINRDELLAKIAALG